MNIIRCFEILEISPDSTYEDSKAAYRLLAQVWHPDKHSHNEKILFKATSKIKELNTAWSEIEAYFKIRTARDADARVSDRQACEEREQSQKAEQHSKRRQATEQSAFEKERQSNMTGRTSNSVEKSKSSNAIQQILQGFVRYSKRIR